MTLFVVDASVAVKWYFEEEYAEAARRLLGPSHTLMAPDLLVLEVGNAVWKRVRRGETAPAAGDTVIQSLLAADFVKVPSAEFAAAALQAAVGTDRSVYDCSYLALALRESCALVTADRRFHDALVARSYGTHLLWVENVP